MAIKIKHTNPSLNEFATDDLVVNINEGALFFKSNTKLFRIQGDNILTTGSLESGIFYEGMDLFPPTIKREEQQANQVTTKTYWVDNEDVKADVHIGAQVELSSNNPVYPRLAIQPPGHTGGPFALYARDDASSAYLDWHYGLTTGNHIMTFKHTGNVGIGTTSPSARVHIEGSNETLRIVSPTAGNTHFSYNGVDNYFSYATTGNTFFRTYNGSAYTNRVFISGSGEVGIGLITPSQQLHIKENMMMGDNAGGGNFIHGRDNLALSADGVVSIVADANDTSGVGSSDLFLGYGSSVDLNSVATSSYGDTFPSNTPRVTLIKLDSSANNVGIGNNFTGTADMRLHVSSSDVNILKLERSDVNNVNVAYTNTTGTMYAGIDTISSALIWGVGSNQDMSAGAVLTVSGDKVGIGTTAPSHTLTVDMSSDVNHIYNQSTNANGLFIKGNGTARAAHTGPDGPGIYLSSGTTSTAEFNPALISVASKDSGGGGLHILTIPPDDHADHPGLVIRMDDAQATSDASRFAEHSDIVQFFNYTTESFRIAHDGTLTGLDTSIGSLSDKRLKKNIENYQYDLEKFKQLKTRIFDWKNPKEHGNKFQQIGFIAQDLEKIDPRWVKEHKINLESPDNDFLDKDKISKTTPLGQTDAMYVSIIQQLITKVENIEKELKELKNGK